MLALTYRGPNKVRVLRVTRTAICGSDLHLLHGFVPDTRVAGVVVRDVLLL